MIKPKKSLGQNFLIDQNIIDKIINVVDIKNKSILEIGPGTGNLTVNILKKDPITIWGDGSARRDYLFAEDLAKIVCQMILKKDICGEFNVASSSVHSVLEVIKLIESKINIPANIMFEDSKDVDVSCNSLDTSKIKKIIEFKPHNLDYGLNKIIKKIPIKNE